MRNRSTLLIAGMLSLALLGTACTGGSTNGNANEPAPQGLFISGSSTVEPITALVAEFFAEENPDVSVSVEGPGTGDGFELFCNGETDVSDASRTIKEEEAAICEQNNIEYTELEVGIDGLTVMTSPENTAVTCLNFADLYALMGPESEGFDTWSDANDLGEELGGIGTPYPDAELVMVAPGEESGTYDSFLEIAFGDIAEEREQEEVARPDYQSSPNDNVIIEGIAGSPSSLGWVGFSFFVQNQDVVKAIEVAEADGSECVAPNEETISGGTYPLQRSLYIYVNKTKAEANPALVQFVDLYMESGLETAVPEVGYITLPAERITASQETWASEKPAA